MTERVLFGPGGATEAKQLPDGHNVTIATSSLRVLLDYDGRVDGNPVYVGIAPQATATSAAAWRVLFLDYDATGRLTDKQELDDSIWDDRATLGWA